MSNRPKRSQTDRSYRSVGLITNQPSVGQTVGLLTTLAVTVKGTLLLFVAEASIEMAPDLRLFQARR
jgi:hypothetical protein